MDVQEFHLWTTKSMHEIAKLLQKGVVLKECVGIVLRPNSWT